MRTAAAPETVSGDVRRTASTRLEPAAARPRPHLRLATTGGAPTGDIPRKLRDPGLLAVPLMLAVAAAAAYWAGGPILALLLVSAALGGVVVLARSRPAAARRFSRRKEARAFETLRNGALEPRVLCDELGRLIAANESFRRLAPRRLVGAALDRALQASESAGGPEAAAEVYRLARAARRNGAARSARLLLGGEPRSVTVEACGRNLFEWRFEPVEPPRGAALATALDLLGVAAVAEGGDGMVEPNATAVAAAPKLSADLATGRPFSGVPEAEGAVAVRPLALDGDSGVRILTESPAPADEAQAFTKSLSRLPVPLARICRLGRVISLNAPARRLLGPAAEPGADLTGLLEGLGRSMTERIVEAARGGGTGRSEMARARRDDREAFLQVSLTQVEIAGETSLLAVMNDATELKTLEEQFVQSQKMQAVGQLAGGVAHDFNNLLTAILGHCDLLLMRRNASEEDFSDLAQIRQNANRAAALVRQMLAFSRKQTLRPEVLDLGVVLRDLSHLLDRLIGERARLEIDLSADLGRVRADHRQLEQVIVNLVVNARDAMPDGGAIRLSSFNETLHEERRRDRAVMPAGEYVTIQVADEGGGIPPDRISQIFEPFYTTKKLGEGTGLGLSTAYGIIKQTGGFIFAESPPGDGAVFSVHLPRYRSDASAAEEFSAAPDAVEAVASGSVTSGRQTRDPEHEAHARDAGVIRQGGRRIEPLAGGACASNKSDAPIISGTVAPSVASFVAPGSKAGAVLLVEDEAPVRSFASRALALRGWTVIEADCAEKALERLEDPDLRVDVVVSDVVMPGLDGPSWVRMARRARPDLAVVFVSGYADAVFRRHLGDLGDYKFLPKPYSLSDLADAIEEVQAVRAAAAL